MPKWSGWPSGRRPVKSCSSDAWQFNIRRVSLLHLLESASSKTYSGLSGLQTDQICHRRLSPRATEAAHRARQRRSASSHERVGDRRGLSAVRWEALADSRLAALGLPSLLVPEVEQHAVGRSGEPRLVLQDEAIGAAVIKRRNELDPTCREPMVSWSRASQPLASAPSRLEQLIDGPRLLRAHQRQALQ